MPKEKILIIADLGGCPPDTFYERIAENYHIVSYIPRPFAISTDHAKYIERYSIAIIKDASYLNKIEDYKHLDSIYWAQNEYKKDENEVVKDIMKVAQMFNVSAITTNNELFVVPLSKACENLGLRGASVEGAIKARDKNLMRETFNKVGVKSIKSKRVNTIEDFKAALNSVGTPFVLKPTYLASSIGVTLFKSEEGAVEKFIKVKEFLETLSVPEAVTYKAPFIVEEYLEGYTDDWYENQIYAPYVSVEGFMINGQYHPVAIHDKYEQLQFTETAHITSSVLDEESKQVIIQNVKKANESLGLKYCATHTEVKLMKNKEVGIIETAARFAGWNMIPNICKVFNINMPKILGDILIKGYSDDLPNTLLESPTGYLCDFHLYPDDLKNNGQLPSRISSFELINLDFDENILVGDTKINNFEFPKNKIIDLSLFESFNSIAEFELKSSSSLDLMQSIKAIKENVKIKWKEPV